MIEGLIENRDDNVSKRLINRIFETFRPYGFSRSDIEETLNSSGLESYSTETLAIINIKLPMILATFFSKDHGLDDVHIPKTRDFLKLLIAKIVSNNSFEDVFLTVGMGGSAVSPSIRLPAFIVSPIHSLLELEKLHRDGIIKGIPKLRVFKTDFFSSRMNDFDLKKVLEASEETFSLLTDFIRYFFPQLEQYVFFERDNDWMSEPSTEEERHVRLVADLIKSRNETRNEIDALMRMGEKHGGQQGAENAFLYAGAHPFYNQTMIINGANHMFQSFQRAAEPSMIVDYGGRPQSIFNKLIDGIREDPQLKSYRQPVMVEVTMPTGKVPVYYRARDYDIGIDEDPESFDIKRIDRLTKKDYQAIEGLVGMDCYLGFLKSRFERISRIRTDEE